MKERILNKNFEFYKIAQREEVEAGKEGERERESRIKLICRGSGGQGH